MTQLSSIEQAWRVALLLGAGMGPLLVLRWVWWRISAWGELAGLAVSLLAAWPLLCGVADEAGRLLVMAGLATGAGVIVSWWTPERPERLRDFWLRAHPPGWWGPVGGASEDLRRLGRGVAAMLAASLSLFALLVGLGTWLCRSPVPTWWALPRGVWIGALLGLGAALVPLWWRLGFAPEAGAKLFQGREG